MAKLLSLFVLVFVIPTNSLGQNKRDKKIMANLDELIVSRLPNVAPGCVVLVAKKGNIIYRKAFGLANVESNIRYAV